MCKAKAEILLAYLLTPSRPTYHGDERIESGGGHGQCDNGAGA